MLDLGEHTMNSCLHTAYISALRFSFSYREEEQLFYSTPTVKGKSNVDLTLSPLSQIKLKF